MSKMETRESVVLKNNHQKIFGVFHRPVGIKKPPVVLICHGLAGDKTGKFRVYVILSQLLAKFGIASLRFDFRGSGDSEGDFSDMTIESEVSDALVALDFLQHSEHVDSSRIGIFGRSLGGSVAVIAASHHHKLIKSLVTWAPLSDGDQWLSQWESLQSSELDEKIKRTAMQVNGQVPGKAFFEQLFKMKIDEALLLLQHVPFLHIHGENDEVVLLEHADKYERFRHNALEKTRFIRLPNSNHDFADIEEQQIALNETCQWFLSTL